MQSAPSRRSPSPPGFHQSPEMAQLKMTKWHSYAPTSAPVTTSPPPTPSMLPPLNALPKPQPQLLPSLMSSNLLRFLLDQPARTAEPMPAHVVLPMSQVAQPTLSPRPEERKRLASSGLMCLVEAAARVPGPGDQEMPDNSCSDSKRQKRIERTDNIGSFIHVYNPLEATRRGRPRGRPFAKAAEHARKGRNSPVNAPAAQDQQAGVSVPTAWLRPELSARQTRSESETAA